jgi:hypothetical protein
MVELLEQTTNTCVVVEFRGRVSGDEYKTFLDAVDERLAKNEPINLVAVLSEFVFYGDFEAMKEDAHFGMHEFRKMHRVAFVGDERWIEAFTVLAKPFSRAQEKRFGSGQVKEACDWASS